MENAVGIYGPVSLLLRVTRSINRDTTATLGTRK